MTENCQKKNVRHQYTPCSSADPGCMNVQLTTPNCSSYSFSIDPIHTSLKDGCVNTGWQSVFLLWTRVGFHPSKGIQLFPLSWGLPFKPCFVLFWSTLSPASYGPVLRSLWRAAVRRKVLLKSLPRGPVGAEMHLWVFKKDSNCNPLCLTPRFPPSKKNPVPYAKKNQTRIFFKNKMKMTFSGSWILPDITHMENKRKTRISWRTPCEDTRASIFSSYTALARPDRCCHWPTYVESTP